MGFSVFTQREKYLHILLDVGTDNRSLSDFVAFASKLVIICNNSKDNIADFRYMQAVSGGRAVTSTGVVISLLLCLHPAEVSFVFQSRKRPRSDVKADASPSNAKELCQSTESGRSNSTDLTDTAFQLFSNKSPSNVCLTCFCVRRRCLSKISSPLLQCTLYSGVTRWGKDGG